nr:hypothetical protein [Tanacetum cinerariifolium]
IGRPMRNRDYASWDLGQMHMGRSGQGVGTSSASDAPTDSGELLGWRVLREALRLILLALAGLSVVPVACLHLFSCVLAGTNVGAGCVNVTEDEIECFGGAFYAVD